MRLGARSQKKSLPENDAMTHRFWLMLNQSWKDAVEWDHPKMEIEQVVCPENPGHRRSGRRLTDLSVILPSKHAADVVWTWQSELLVQDHVLVFIRENDLTGLTAKEVSARIQRTSTLTPPRLWEIQVTGWGGMAPDAGIDIVQSCPTCQYREYSIANPSRVIDPRQWDGSDFFMVWPLPRFVFLSDRAARLLRDSRFTGMRIIPAEELPIKPGGTVSPGLLSRWMPRERAEALGGPLGIA